MKKKWKRFYIIIKNRLFNREEYKLHLNVSHLNHKSFDYKHDEYVTSVK